ncbi:MAG TPA: hypothetical protein VM536_00610 [Chloroflexia bacterium]|nr:hypothetical protein [Chloroflexia bacterium]
MPNAWARLREKSPRTGKPDGARLRYLGSVAPLTLAAQEPTMYDPAEPPFARIEDLDPEPEAWGAQVRRREWIVGLVLVLLIGGLAGGQWWRQQTAWAHYQAGVAAAARYDWPTAAVAFTAAGGYGDATVRAQDATTKAVERAAQYKAASAAVATGRWPAALAALQRVAAISPGYRDSARLLPVAEEATFGQALSDTVVLRAGADPPGLYSYGAGRWQWLPGSDARSRVLAACPGGGAVYDGPIPAAALVGPTAVPTPDGPAAERQQRYAGRHLLSGGPGQQWPLRVAGLDLSQFDQYRCTVAGVWGLRGGTGVAQAATTPALVPARLTGAAFAPFDGVDPLVPRLPGSDWTLVDLAPDGASLLAVKIAGRTPETVQLSLALLARDGTIRTPLGDSVGPLLAAHFSADSRYLVLTSLRVVSAQHGLRRTLLVDTQTHSRLVLAQVAVDWRASPSELGTADPFLLHGPRRDQVVVTALDGGRQVVHVIDPAHAETPLATVPVENGGPGLRFSNAAPDDAAMLLAWLDPARAAGGPPGFLAYLDPASRVTPVHPAVAPPGDLWYTWLRGDYLVYEIREAAADRAPLGYTLAVQPRAGLSAAAVAPTTIFTGTLTRAAAGGLLTAPAYLGAGLLAYINAGSELRARTYDGTTDLLLDRDVRALYPLHPSDSP